MKSKKFLEFNGKTIFFQSYDGQFWIAIKPICDALGVNYNRQYQNLKNHTILSRVFANQQMHDKSNRVQSMVCLPEKFIYGWIFKIQSNAPGLEEFQFECFSVLFNYFRGSITGRSELLKQQIEVESELEVAKAKLLESEEYKALQELKKKNSTVAKKLTQNDESIKQEIMELEFPETN